MTMLRPLYEDKPTKDYYDLPLYSCLMFYDGLKHELFI